MPTRTPPAERVQHDLHTVLCACGLEHTATRPAGVPDTPLSTAPRLRALAGEQERRVDGPDRQRQLVPMPEPPVNTSAVTVPTSPNAIAFGRAAHVHPIAYGQRNLPRDRHVRRTEQAEFWIISRGTLEAPSAVL